MLCLCPWALDAERPPPRKSRQKRDELPESGRQRLPVAGHRGGPRPGNKRTLALSWFGRHYLLSTLVCLCLSLRTPVLRASWVTLPTCSTRRSLEQRMTTLTLSRSRYLRHVPKQRGRGDGMNVNVDCSLCQINGECSSFQSVDLLKSRPAHLAVFLHHVVSQFDPAPLVRKR